MGTRLALSVAACATLLAATNVMAQERMGDAALGAISGAVVLGPIGAAAGAVVGYTGGPSIAHAFKQHNPFRPARPVSVSASARAKVSAAPPLPRPAPAAAGPRGASSPNGEVPAQSFE
jgi:hypothetical protein